MAVVLSIPWVCLMLVWAPPVLASDGPPVQRPRARLVAPAEPVVVDTPPAPVEPESAPIEIPPVQAEPAPLPVPRATGQLPSYHTPIAADALSLEPERRRDRPSEAMIATGSVLLSSGLIVGLVGAGLWHQNLLWSWADDGVPDPKPAILGGVGIAAFVAGAAMMGAGFARQKRLRKSLDGTARVRVQPVIGFGQLGVVGRF